MSFCIVQEANNLFFPVNMIIRSAFTSCILKGKQSKAFVFDSIQDVRHSAHSLQAKWRGPESNTQGDHLSWWLDQLLQSHTQTHQCFPKYLAQHSYMWIASRGIRGGVFVYPSQHIRHASKVFPSKPLGWNGWLQKRLCMYLKTDGRTFWCS